MSTASSTTRTRIEKPETDADDRAPVRTRRVRIGGAAWRIERTLNDQGAGVSARTVKRMLDDEFVDDETGWEPGDAHEACEIAVTRLLLHYGRVMNGAAKSRDELDGFIRTTAGAEPRIRGRSRRHDAVQHYATPLEVAWAMAVLADVEPGDTVLDPSAGTGTLLAMAHVAQPDATLHACEGDSLRANLLRDAARTDEPSPTTAPPRAPAIEVVRGDALTLHEERPDWLGEHDAVLMNPPFSARLGSRGRHRNEDLRHLVAAGRAAKPGGVIAALLGGGIVPRNQAWEKRIDGRLQLVWYAVLDGSLMKNREISIATNLCLLRNEEEDDTFDVRDAERYRDADALLHAARAATGQA